MKDIFEEAREIEAEKVTSCELTAGDIATNGSGDEVKQNLNDSSLIPEQENMNTGDGIEESISEEQIIAYYDEIYDLSIRERIDFIDKNVNIQLEDNLIKQYEESYRIQLDLLNTEVDMFTLDIRVKTGKRALELAMDENYDFPQSRFKIDLLQKKLDEMIAAIKNKRRLVKQQIDVVKKRIRKYTPVMPQDDKDIIMLFQLAFGDSFNDSRITESIEMCDDTVSSCLALMETDLPSIAQELRDEIHNFDNEEMEIVALIYQLEWVKKIKNINRKILLGFKIEEGAFIDYVLGEFIESRNTGDENAYMREFKHPEDDECLFYDADTEEAIIAYYESKGEDADNGVDETFDLIYKMSERLFCEYAFIMTLQINVSKTIQSQITPPPESFELFDSMATETVNKYIQLSEWKLFSEEVKSDLDHMLNDLAQVIPERSQKMRTLFLDFIEYKELCAFESNKAELCEQWKKLHADGRIFSPQYMSKSGKNKKKSSKKKSKR